METDRIMSTIMKYFKDFGVGHDISENFSCEPERLKISFLIQIPYINKKSIFSIIKLNHFHKTSLSEISFEINSQYFTVENVRSAHH